MQDRNAKAPKVRSGDEINPVLGTIVKVASLIVVAALVVLITYIVIELLNKEDKNVNPFTDRIEISVDDFKTIVEGEDFNNLSSNVRDIMIESQEDDDIFFFFYYSNLTNKIDEEIRSEEHTSELQSRPHLVCRLLLEKKKKNKQNTPETKKKKHTITHNTTNRQQLITTHNTL